MLSEVKQLSPVWHRHTDILVDHGEGCYLYDTRGEKYLDFTSGIGVTNTGHAHPRVVRAVSEQAAKLLHGQINIVLHEPVLDLIHELKSVVPDQVDGFFFSNSGAEAVEGAVKLARQATGKPNLIAFQGGFHGRTMGTMSLTSSKTGYRSGYQPLIPGVFFTPYPYPYRYGWSDAQTQAWCLDELRFLLETQTAPEETAAVLIEPVLGEGGYVVPPQGFLQGLREICDEHGMLLITDEVQSGIGRTGKWFAFEHFEVVPDIIVAAKGLASGLPLSGVFSSMGLMERWTPGSHGGTMGGNVVACAAAAETLRVIREEELLENASVLGEDFRRGLRGLSEKYPRMGEVRGLGLMNGVEFTRADGSPDAEITKEIIRQARNKGLLLISCGTYNNVIRFIPPLTVSDNEIGQCLSVLEDVLSGVNC